MAEDVLEAKRRRISEAEDRSGFHEERGRLARAEAGILERENGYGLRLIRELERLRRERLRSLEYYERRAGRLDISVYEREVARRIAEDLRADLERIDRRIRTLREEAAGRRSRIAELRRRAGLHVYWANYHRAVAYRWRADLLLEEVRDRLIPELERGVPPERRSMIASRAREIEGEAEALRILVEAELRRAEERGWRRITGIYRMALRLLDALRDALKRLWSMLRRLYKVKIRLYNIIMGPNGSPEGEFQFWVDIDAMIDPETGIPEWDWWLTEEEIAVAKREMLSYFKGMNKWLGPEDVGLSYYLDEETARRGIAYREEPVSFKMKKRTGELYVKNVPYWWIERARRLTVEELVVGESSVEPREIVDLEEEMGVYFEKAMIIDEGGEVKWCEWIEEWVWHPLPPEYVERMRRELGWR